MKRNLFVLFILIFTRVLSVLGSNYEIHHLNAAFVNSDTTFVDSTVCGSISLQSINYSKDTIVNLSFTNLSGGDSIVQVNVKINNYPKVESQSGDVTVCDDGVGIFTVNVPDAIAYAWQWSDFDNGVWAFSDGTYEETMFESDSMVITSLAQGAWDGYYIRCIFINVEGCISFSDSVLITINNSSDTTSLLFLDKDSVLYEDKYYTMDTVFVYNYQNQVGCDSVVKVNIIIGEAPMVTDQSGDVTVCDDGIGVFTVKAINTDAYEWQWLDGTNWVASTGKYFESFYDTDSMVISSLFDGDWNDYFIRCKVSNSKGLFSYSDPVYVTINYSSDTTYIDTLGCFPLSYDGVQYSQDTVLTFTLSNESGCDSIIQVSIERDNTANCQPNAITSNANANQMYSLYPNPSNGDVHVLFGNLDTKVEVFTIGGILVRDAFISYTNSGANLKLPSETGIYLVKIIEKTGKISVLKVLRN